MLRNVYTIFFNFFASNNYLNQNDTYNLLLDIAEELKMFNNNYRPIYHLEECYIKY